jgi:hypothetical protein
MTRNHAILHDFELVQCGTWWVHLRDNHPVGIMGIGSIIDEAMVGKECHPIRIENVLYVPELCKTLLLVCADMRHGVTMTFKPLDFCWMIDLNGRVVLEGEPVSNGLFKVNINLSFIKMVEEGNSASLIYVCEWTLHDIHLQFGHPGDRCTRMIVVALEISQPLCVGHMIHSEWGIRRSEFQRRIDCEQLKKVCSSKCHLSGIR